jgi:hypothetical protein
MHHNPQDTCHHLQANNACLFRFSFSFFAVTFPITRAARSLAYASWNTQYVLVTLYSAWAVREAFLDKYADEGLATLEDIGVLRV